MTPQDHAANLEEALDGDCVCAAPGAECQCGEMYRVILAAEIRRLQAALRASLAREENMRNALIEIGGLSGLEEWSDACGDLESIDMIVDKALAPSPDTRREGAK